MPNLDPRDLGALVADIRAETEVWERRENDNTLDRYQNDFSSWLQNSPIQRAMGLEVDEEPEPPLKANFDFDVENFRIVKAYGPEQFERLKPPPPPAPPQSDAIPGEPWANNPGLRHVKRGDNSQPPTEVTFEGAKWVRENWPNPFNPEGGTKVWRRK